MENAESRWRRWLRMDVLLTLAGVGAGTAGALLAGQYLTERAAAAEAAAARRYRSREIVVVSADVARGEALGGKNLAVRKVPQDFIPADAIPAARAAQVLGKRAAINIARGTPVLEAALADEQAGPSRLSATLAANERALTIAVDELSSQAGGVGAGDRVDLFYGRRDGGEALLVPLQQQVEVLVAGDAPNSGATEDAPRHYATVTLRVRTEDAPRILLAQQSGDLFMLLRSPGDNTVAPATLRSSRELLRRPPVQSVATGVELLTGGTGDLMPRRTWLSQGLAAGRDAT